ncbi:unnamed protein product [Rotaria sordida]|uniref:Malonyl-CoA:ACP transacylase (MAT) domain-containing protein n=1 Tax=Rotaria sordida TaxID=392033 RepID=A0A819ULY7_9BILA|nr:unnamed protein product [Rotaria sordida]CAF4096631.1 unnamed protein product [Rotaria sordida]
MVLFRYSLELCSRYRLLSQQIRFLHRSTYLLARGIRHSVEHPPISTSSFTNLDQNISIDNDDNNNNNNQMSIQEQFARLELQRLEQESKQIKDESSSFVDEDNLNQEEFENEEKLSRPFIDPSTTSIILFPGQGTQFIGMGQQVINYPNVKEMFNIAHRILGYDLYSKCINGPIEELNQTLYAQPAIYVTSLAAVQKLKNENQKAIENCVVTAGFSIGEITALVFAGCMTYEDGLRLIKIRAEAMQTTSNEVNSGMMSVFVGRETKLTLAIEAAREWCNKYMKIDIPCIQIANHMYAECKVLAGHKEALQFIAHNYKVFGIRRIKYLSVSGAFHTPLMASAKLKLIKALDKIDMQPPLIQVMSNVTGKRHSNDVATIKRSLSQQLTKCVLWEQSIHKMYQRAKHESYPNTFECGPGRQLGYLLRLNNNKAYQQYHHVDV